MQAWVTGDEPGALTLEELRMPEAGAGEVVVGVEACAVCRTDLHIIDRDLPVHRPHVVPGHQIVGRVASVGPRVHSLRVGDRVGVAWLRRTCGACRWCREGRENLCPTAEFTGWDADGGFAEYTLVPEAYAYRIETEGDAAAIAPLLCAGIIGHRALARARLPAGGRLGVYGFGSSALITSLVATAQGARVYAMSRGAANRELARRAGAVFVGEATDSPPRPLDSAIVFAPAGELVPVALQATDRGGTVVIAGIHVTDIPEMRYADDLFFERDLRTVTANTRADGAAFLRLADSLRLRTSVTRFDFARTADAVGALRAGSRAGTLVVDMTL